MFVCRIKTKSLPNLYKMMYHMSDTKMLLMKSFFSVNAFQHEDGQCNGNHNKGRFLNEKHQNYSSNLFLKKNFHPVVYFDRLRD